MPHSSATFEHIPLFKDLPEIPDLGSKSSSRIMLDDTAPSISLPKKSQSKLSKLATSKASSINSMSESSRSSGTSVTDSVKTYPALRPSAQSERPLSSIVSKELPGTPKLSSGSNLSSTSSIVRRAIQTAIEFESMGHETDNRPLPSRSPEASDRSDRSRTPTPGQNIKYMQPSASNKTDPPFQPRALSKLAMLAQQKADAASRSLSSPDISSPSVTTSRPLSKLAMLAQQKVDATRAPKLPKTTTEYLTPIANGTSVTTAITTSYQSLYSLTDPSRPSVIPKLEVVPLQFLPGPSTNQKASKLALKIKRVGEKVNQTSEEVTTPVISPIFQPSPTRARASPSAFASVLIHTHGVSPQAKAKEKRPKHSKEHKHKNLPGTDYSSSSMDNKPPSGLNTSTGVSLKSVSNQFAFDDPSPDDIVLDARKRSTLGSKPSTKRW